MPKCECGCGQQSVRVFLPGHDQKLRILLERRTGGLLSLRAIVDIAESHFRGEVTEHALSEKIMAVFKNPVNKVLTRVGGSSE